MPTAAESLLLDTYFHFHPLAIEDCMHILQRPKLDYYEDVQFFVLHALNERTLAAEEVDLFLSKNFLVSYHHQEKSEMDEILGFGAIGDSQPQGLVGRSNCGSLHRNGQAGR